MGHGRRRGQPRKGGGGPAPGAGKSPYNTFEEVLEQGMDMTGQKPGAGLAAGLQREEPAGARCGFIHTPSNTDSSVAESAGQSLEPASVPTASTPSTASSFFSKERRKKEMRNTEKGGGGAQMQRRQKREHPQPPSAAHQLRANGTIPPAPKLQRGGLKRPAPRILLSRQAASTHGKDLPVTEAMNFPEVVDLLSSDSDDDAAQGDQADPDASKVPAAVVLERFRGAGSPVNLHPPSPQEWCMSAAGIGMRVGTLEVGNSTLEANSTGLRATFPLASIPDLEGLSGHAILAVDWGAVNDFWISGKHSEPGQHLVVFGFPHMLPSLRPYLDPGGLDHEKRHVVFRIDKPIWGPQNPVSWSVSLVRMVQDFLQGTRRNCIMTRELANFFSGHSGPFCPLELERQDGMRHSVRLDNAFKSGKDGGIKDPFVYPKVGDPQAVMVHPQDLFRLRRLEYLNDTLIDFYLQYLRNEVFPVRAQKAHMFSSFFYRKLAQRRKKEPREEGVTFGQALHQRVSKWTQNVDIFTKDYLFVPINKSEHWILAVVCHPGRAFVADAKETSERKGGSTNFSGTPCILIFDSLGGRHNHSAKLLMDYLTWEWRSKPHGIGEVTEEVQKFQGVMSVWHPSVPKQTNLSDCGLFLLHYAEKFLSEGPEQIKPPSWSEPERVGRRSKRRGVWQRMRGVVGELFDGSSQGEPAGEGGRTQENSSHAEWPYMFNPKWFRPSEASMKRQSLLMLIKAIGPKLKVPCGSLGIDRIAEEMGLFQADKS